MTKTIGQVSDAASLGSRRQMTDAELIARAEALASEVDPSQADQVRFRGTQFDAGLAWVHHPVGLGGLGIERDRQAIVREVLRHAGARYRDLLVNPMGIEMGAPTLMAHGTGDQQRRYLRRIFTGEEIWCQLFSEPSSGSDLASLASTAVLDGDEWVVNGQKVWTTLAHVASIGMLLVRTDLDGPKHKGLTYLLVDMSAPGVEVRPLFQMTGEAEFNEVFLSDVRIPRRDVVGEVGGGWPVATTTLVSERSAIGSSSTTPRRGMLGRLLDAWDAHRNDLSPARRAVIRDRITDLWIRSEVQRLTTSRARAKVSSRMPGPEASIVKLAAAELRQVISEACVDLEGAHGTLHPSGYPMARTDEIALDTGTTGRFLRARAATIEGGTSEIMRNILGERILGLPAEPRADAGIPWRNLPR